MRPPRAGVATRDSPITYKEHHASEKDLAGLLGKLDGAAKALSAGKNSGAVQKLTDFREKVVTLQLQGKAGPEAAQLVSGADAAIACIERL